MLHSIVALLAATRRQLIYNGIDIEPADAPFVVRLYWQAQGSGYCGGSLVDSTTVLTAAHCVYYNTGTEEDPTYVLDPASSVWVGTLRKFTGLDYGLDLVDVPNQPNADLVQVSDIMVDPQYDPYDIGQGHDAAILRITRVPALFGQEGGPRAVVFGDQTYWPPSVRAPLKAAYVVGYGADVYGGPQSKALEAAPVNLMTRPECEAADQLGAALHPSNQCATRVLSNGQSVDACSGDSGGPLVVVDDGEFVQVGIVSWGFGDCTVPQYPGVYSRTVMPTGSSNEDSLAFIQQQVADVTVRSLTGVDFTGDACECNTAADCTSNGVATSPYCGCAQHISTTPPFCYVSNPRHCLTDTPSGLFLGAMYADCTVVVRPPPSAPPPSAPPPSAPPPSCEELKDQYRSQGCCSA